jgi:hypothetical protein
MTLLAPALLVLTPIPAPETVHLRASRGGVDLGEVAITQTLTKEGGKTVDLHLVLQAPGVRQEVSQHSEYDAEGWPTRKELRIEGGQGGPVATVIAFDGEGAVVRAPGAVEPRRVPLVAGAPRRNASEFWFLRDRPKPGARVTTYAFDPDRLEWTLTTIDYRGTGDVGTGSAKVTGHRVHVRQGDRTIDSVLDDKGLPLRVEDSDGLRLTRKEAK